MQSSFVARGSYHVLFVGNMMPQGSVRFQPSGGLALVAIGPKEPAKNQCRNWLASAAARGIFKAPIDESLGAAPGGVEDAEAGLTHLNDQSFNQLSVAGMREPGVDTIQTI